MAISVIAVTLLSFASPMTAVAQHEFPRVDLPKQLPPHPRVFWNDKEVGEFKAWMARTPWLKRYIDELTAELAKTVDNPQLPGRNQSGNVGIAKQANNYAIVYVLSGERRYAEAVANILRGYVKVFPSYPIAHLKGKATSATLEECDWAINIASAYDLIYNSGVLSDEEKQRVEQEVLKASAEVMRDCNHRFRSNWRGRAIAGVGVIGFCIGDQDLMNEAVNGHYDSSGRLARDGFVQHVAWSILADGVFYERSLHYHMYTADSYTLIAEVARHAGIDLWHMEIPGHPLDAGSDMERRFGQTGKRTVKSVFDSQFYEAFSDKSLVRLGNSYTDRLERQRCYERAWAAYGDPKYAWILRRPVKFYRPIAGGGYIDPEKDNNAQIAKLGLTETDPNARRPLNPIELMWMSPDLPQGHFDHSADATVGITGRHENFCSFLPNGGITVLRSSPKPEAVNVQMTYGDWGSCHTHPELLAITVCAEGQQMIPEVRYHHYGHEKFLNWDRQTIAHNTVTVDEVSQYPQQDSEDRWIVERGGKQATGYPVLFHAGDRLKVTRAKCEAAYEGVVLDRTTALVDDMIVDFYRCRSEKQHQYDFALHIDGILDASSQQFSPPLPGAISDKFGYMHMKNPRLLKTTGPGVELTYIGSGEKAGDRTGPTMRLQLLSQGETELISAKGHADLKGKVKDVLILRRHGLGSDFVNVIGFPNTKNLKAHRLNDTPPGVLGVELKKEDGSSLLVLSAETAEAFPYAGLAINGQVALLERSKNGDVKLITAVR